MDEYAADDVMRTITLIERAAFIALAGAGVGALAGFLLGVRLGRRWS